MVLCFFGVGCSLIVVVGLWFGVGLISFNNGWGCCGLLVGLLWCDCVQGFLSCGVCVLGLCCLSG